ncbi:hypothetical protein TNCV_3464961 [Trichonephila clavipes]|nr:hypothetical protein TNCV_3464961 [Trichonephila clavipes]
MAEDFSTNGRASFYLALGCKTGREEMQSEAGEDRRSTTDCYLLTDHQIGTSVHAPQRPMVTCIMMGTVVPGPHGLLCL